MADKLNFKISATDDSKSGFDSFSKNAKNHKKEIADLIKKSKKTGDPFKKMGSQLKGFSKEFDKINKSQTKFGNTFKKINSAGDDLADTLKSVNKEDEVLASKLTQKGKSIQQALKSPQSQIQQQQGQMQKALQQSGASRQMTVQTLKVQKLETKSFAGKGMMGEGGKNLSKQVSNKLSEKIDKNLSEGLGKIGAGVGMIAGGFIAAIGVAYSVMAAKASAFRAQAQQQIGGLQQLGFGAREGIPGQQATGGFYAGYRGRGPGGTETFMTGQQQIEAMTAYARQTGGTRQQIESIMYGRGQGNLSLGALTQAYGLNVGETAGTAGVLQRFQGKGEAGGLNTLIRAMGGAERVGMGGARMKEFLDAMQEAVTQGVMSGSQRTNADMIKGLETLMSTNDERLKALAPEILRTSTQTMNQAAMLQGGPQGNFMFQAVLNQMKKEGGGNLFDVMERLASGDWLKNAQAALQEARQRSGGNEQWTAFNLAKGLGLNIASPKAQQEIARMIEEGRAPGGEPLTQKMFQQEVQRRLESTAQMIEETTKADYVESLHTLSEANLDAAKAVNSLREVITTIVDKGYELGKGATQRFFGVELGPVYSTEKEFR
jgi:hypothetical protein